MIAYFFHPEAVAELEDASIVYESRAAGLGKSFAAEVQLTITLIQRFPDTGLTVGHLRRRVVVPRFPYSLIYRHHTDAIIILAVSHQRRKPGYWRRRKSIEAM